MVSLIKDIVLVGYSGHSFVVAEVLEQLGYTIKGYFDKEPVTRNIMNIPYLGFEGNSEDLNKIKGSLVFPSIGDNRIRRKVFLFLRENDLVIPTAISCKSNVSSYSVIDEGVLVCQGACINPFAIIGKGSVINTGAIVEHECEIDSFVHIAPGAVLAGNVKVGEGSFVGANAVIKQGVTIGKNTIIGAGAVVLNNVDDNQTLVGNPAKKLI